MSKYIKKVSTSILDQYKISSRITDIAGGYMQQVINTQEQQVRESLIKLGWTPPQHEWEIVSQEYFFTKYQCKHCKQSYISNIEEAGLDSEPLPCYRRIKKEQKDTPIRKHDFILVDQGYFKPAYECRLCKGRAPGVTGKPCPGAPSDE